MGYVLWINSAYDLIAHDIGNSLMQIGISHTLVLEMKVGSVPG